MRIACAFGLLLVSSVTCIAQDTPVPTQMFGETFAEVATGPETEADSGTKQQSTQSANPTNTDPQQTSPAPPPDAPSANKNATSQQQPVRLVELSVDNWTPLNKTEKFGLWWQDLISPGTHLALAGSAWLSWTTNDQTYMGPGFGGWAKRYGYNVADEATGQFFSAFFLPVVFKQDPRYLPLNHGSKKRRIAYAMSRVIITRTDSGGEAFNVSHVGGAFIVSALSNAYYPQGRDKSFGATISRPSLGLASDAGYNIFVEFWPDFARKMHLGKFFQQLVRRTVRVPNTTY
jgi:hypothetical protein